jgi:predicted transcriptional regulator
MSITEIAKKRHDLIEWINQLSDTKLISLLDSIRSSNIKGDWWDTLTSEQKDSIERGLEDIEAGRVYSSAEAWKKIRGEK